MTAPDLDPDDAGFPQAQRRPRGRPKLDNPKVRKRVSLPGAQMSYLKKRKGRGKPTPVVVTIFHQLQGSVPAPQSKAYPPRDCTKKGGGSVDLFFEPATWAAIDADRLKLGYGALSDYVRVLLSLAQHRGS